MFTRLLHFLGFQKCFTCGRWRFAHNPDQAARCDYSPLPVTLANASGDEGHRRGDHRQAG